MQKLIEDWKATAEGGQERNFKFLRWLKGLEEKKVDTLAKKTHKEVFSEIDCVQCTNCCRTLKPEFREKDVVKVAAMLELEKTAFTDRYLVRNDQGNWTTTTLPCPFLGQTGECGIYALRPEDCRSFPRTDSRHFAARSWLHTENAITCPAVFHILERLKAATFYHD